MRTELVSAGARRLFWRSWLGLCLAGQLIGCAAGTPRVASDLAGQVPNDLRADYFSFTENCSKCHDLERPLRAHIDDVRHWDLYVAKMMRTAGSAISKRESPKILRFLYWYTQRKVRLEAERAKEVSEPALEKAAPSPAPAAPAPPAAEAPAAAPSAPAPADANAVYPAPAQVNAPAQVQQGDGAP